MIRGRALGPGRRAAWLVLCLVPASIGCNRGEPDRPDPSAYDEPTEILLTERTGSDEQLEMALLAVTAPRVLRLIECGSLTDEGMRGVAGAVSLRRIVVQGCNGLTDSGLAPLASLPELESLELRSLVGLTHRGVRALARSRSLYSLSLSGCRGVNDNALRGLQVNTGLRTLDLTFCPEITDRGLLYLSRMSSLRLIELAGTGVTAGGVQRLRRALPGCTIQD